MPIRQGPLNLRLVQTLAAASTVALGAAGVIFQINRDHAAALESLQFECDAALERAYDAEQRRDDYISDLERDSQALQRAGAGYQEREVQLQESRLELDLALEDRQASLRGAEQHYQAALQIATSEVGERLATSERENAELKRLKSDLLDAYGDQILSGEGYRRSVERELRGLSQTLAYEQWQKTVRIAVEGECSATWGARKFQRCARRVEAALRVHEKGALECIIGGYGLPFYAADQQVQVFPENSAVLKHGVVVPCDRSLHDRDYGGSSQSSNF